MMHVETIKWQHPNRLADDYARKKERAAAFYNGHIDDDGSWVQRLQYLAQTPFQADRGQLIQVLQAYNEKIGNHEAALANIRSLDSSETTVVIGGQQAGLFGGQLLVIYKAISIIKLAREASHRLGKHVVPVFWIAGEDHDLAEVDHIHILQPDLHIQKLKLAQSEGRNRSSISQLEISKDAWEQVIAEFAMQLQETEFKPGIVERLRDTCMESATLSDAFARIMAWLYGSEGLVLVDSADPGLRKLESPMWEQIIARNEQIQQALLAGETAVQEAGYPVQVDVQPNAANLFYYDSGDRLLLFRESDRFVDRHGRVSLSRDQLSEIARMHPEKLSNNVLTRPMMQDYLFPVLAVVLGTSEIAYWGELKPAFAALDLQVPLLAVRSGFTLFEGTLQKQMKKFDLSPEDVLYHLEEKRNDFLQAQDSLGLSEAFTELEQGFKMMYEPIIAKAGTINPGMVKLGDTNLAKIVEQIHFFRSKVDAAWQSQYEAALRQFDRLSASILPQGKLQERVFNLFTYMNRYGQGWLNTLLEDPAVQPRLSTQHYIVYL